VEETLETSEVLDDVLSDGQITPSDVETVVDSLMEDGEITQSEVNDLSETLSSDGQFTQEEKQLVAAVLIESANGEAITVESIAEAGLSLEDLPPTTPVELRQDENGNAVIISAVVADALQLLESPAEILTAIFESPAELIFAIGNLGADMSEEEREEATKTIVAATIVGNIAANAAVTASIGAVGYRRKP
jgi:polyhydroxyalkanoate synthesis regulator phasin